MKKPKNPKLSERLDRAAREQAKRDAVRVLVMTLYANLEYPIVNGFRMVPWPNMQERYIVARGIAALS